jgi:hypothetical protein
MHDALLAVLDGDRRGSQRGRRGSPREGPEAMEDWRGTRRRSGWSIWSAQTSSRTPAWSGANSASGTDNDGDGTRRRRDACELQEKEKGMVRAGMSQRRRKRQRERGGGGLYRPGDGELATAARRSNSRKKGTGALRLGLVLTEREWFLRSGSSGKEWGLGRDLTKGAVWARPDASLVDWRRRAARASRRKGQDLVWGGASVSWVTGRGLWREGRRGGGRSAREGDINWVPATCSTNGRASEHGRERTVETKQIAGVIEKASRILSG